MTDGDLGKDKSAQGKKLLEKLIIVRSTQLNRVEEG